MSATLTDLPLRRRDLILRPLGDDGQHVVKDPRTGEYYNLGSEETFLLLRLDGAHDAESLRAAYQRRFGAELSRQDLDDFRELAESLHLIEPPDAPLAAPANAPPARPRQSILYWRKNFFDPDRLFNWLEPKIRFVWTRGFLIVSSVGILLAVGIVASNGQELVSRFPHLLRWETLLLAWLTLILATTCHEFAHGLTCKHYGGEVHEVGFLLMFFLPCFYCNVSDAWLFQEKSKRLWVTLAGAWCDLVLWATAAILWRLSAQDSLVNYLAWVILSVSGLRIFFNFNPLLKLDGYYLLSDSLCIPNLRQRAWDTTAAHLRWILWGAARPRRDEPRRRFLLSFGVAVWCYSFFFLCAMFLWMAWVMRHRFGFAGVAAVVLLAGVVLRGQFQGLFGEEVKTMLKTRPVRLAGWAAAGVLLALLLSIIPMKDRATGSFTVRPLLRVEVRAPVAAFLQEISVDEGHRLAAGAEVARLWVPDLEARIAQKQAELAEAEARVALMRAGPRAARGGGSATPPADETVIRSAEINVEQAKLRRLEEELKYLHQVRQQLVVIAPAGGVVTTPRLRERIGQHVREGDLICVIEEPQALQAEVALPEQRVARVRRGQSVEIKARALPFQTFAGTVTDVAPAATWGQVHSTVTVYCRIEDPSPELRPGMTGDARIACGNAAIGKIALDRTLSYLRTEFWW